MKRYIAMLLFSSVSMAAGTTAQVTWTMPTTYVDNSALPVSDILETVVEWRRTVGGPVEGSVRVAAPAVATTVPVACGDALFTAYVITKSTARFPSAVGLPSSPPVAYATGVACVPKAPGLSVS